MRPPDATGARMDFGIHFGTRGCLVARDTVMLLAQRAEALGYAYLGVADHGESSPATNGSTPCSGRSGWNRASSQSG